MVFNKKEMLIINSRVWQYHNPRLNIGNQKPQCRNKENITVLGWQDAATLTFCLLSVSECYLDVRQCGCSSLMERGTLCNVHRATRSLTILKIATSVCSLTLPLVLGSENILKLTSIFLKQTLLRSTLLRNSCGYHRLSKHHRPDSITKGLILIPLIPLQP